MSDRVLERLSGPQDEAAEQIEVEVVLAALERAPRLERLLRYLTDKYFQGQLDQLTEYNIATEVFGRSKTAFNSSDDAIARAEIHRLRKRLKTFYDTEGKDHRTKISIPSGTYIPAFHHGAGHDLAPMTVPPAIQGIQIDCTEPTALDPIEDEECPADVEPLKEQQQARPGNFPRRWAYTIAALAVLAASFLLYRSLRTRSTTTSLPIAQGITAGQQQKGNPSPGDRGVLFTPLPLRLLAGYSGPAQRDSIGDIWQADQYFAGGWPLHQPAVFIARTSDPLLFRSTRSGDCSYDIPLRPGSYELHLYFVRTSSVSQPEEADDRISFNVNINGKPILSDFDVASDAMGRNVADERVFRDISPGPDGKLHIWLSTKIGTPAISAIEILEGTPHKQLPVRLIMQPTPYTDRNGQLWHPDSYYLDGRQLAHNAPDTSTDPDLLLSERYGHFTYAIPVDTRDRYTVVLHFAELYFGSNGISGPGQRVFRVLCNGSTLLDDFDIYREGGSFHMLTKTFHHLKPTAQGKLNLTFEPILNYASVSGIEIIDENE